ncbi:hypothetical protein [Brevundimonas diminuta]|uniref:hypothetical protein n=1 Tax=Brevundimonas diminuta TaxID=293 RepID=UPI003D9AB140
MDRAPGSRRQAQGSPSYFPEGSPPSDASGNHDFVLRAIYDQIAKVSQIDQKVSDGVDRLDRKLDELERRLNERVEQVDKRLECVDGKLGQVEHKVTLVKGIAIAVAAICTVLAFVITTFVATGARIEFGPKAEQASVERPAAE